jgi:hypothetical protein
MSLKALILVRVSIRDKTDQNKPGRRSFPSSLSRHRRGAGGGKHSVPSVPRTTSTSAPILHTFLANPTTLLHALAKQATSHAHTLMAGAHLVLHGHRRTLRHGHPPARPPATPDHSALPSRRRPCWPAHERGCQHRLGPYCKRVRTRRQNVTLQCIWYCNSCEVDLSLSVGCSRCLLVSLSLGFLHKQSSRHRMLWESFHVCVYSKRDGKQWGIGLWRRAQKQRLGETNPTHKSYTQAYDHTCILERGLAKEEKMCTSESAIRLLVWYVQIGEEKVKDGSVLIRFRPNRDPNSD